MPSGQPFIITGGTAGWRRRRCCSRSIMRRRWRIRRPGSSTPAIMDPAAYRQCFYERKLDFAKYDARLPWAVADEAPETVAELALKRLRFPVGLSDRARESYEGFLRDEGAAAARFLVTEEDTEGLKFLLERELLDGPAIETGIQAALDSGKTALVSLLMEERGRRFPRKQKTFEL